MSTQTPISTSPAQIPLSTTSQGDTATVSTGRLEPAERELLSAMGIHDGCQVTVRSVGSPCIVQVQSMRVGIAANVARRLDTQLHAQATDS